MTTPEQDRLTIGETAEKFRVTTTTVGRWLRSGKLKAAGTTPTGRLLVDAAAVALLLGEADL